MGKKRFKVTIEDNTSDEIFINEVDIIVFSGLIKGDDDINRSIMTCVSGDYVDLCRAYTMLGKIINDSFMKKEE